MHNISNMDLKPHHLPILIVLILQVTFAVTFYLACFYYDDHVTYFLPYISDTGTIPPESCIFGQSLNVVALILGCIIYLKYRQVGEILYRHNISGKSGINKVAMLIGICVAIGIDIVANFQETNCFVVHWIGAVMTFGGAALYLCLQTNLYFAISPVIGQRKLTQIRVLLSIISSVTFVMFVVFAFISYREFDGEDYTKWEKKYAGYSLHQVSTNAEWVCAGCTAIYILLLYKEFKHISVENVKIRVHELYHVKDAANSASSDNISNT